MRNQAFSTLRLSTTLMKGSPVAVLCLIPVLVFAFLRILQGNGRALTTMDILVDAHDPSVGLPLLWFLCPIVAMASLIVLWKRKDSIQVTIRQGGPLRVWSSYVCDAVLVSFFAALLLHASLMIMGFAFTGVGSDFDSSSSVFSRELSGATVEGFPFPQASALVFLYGFLVLLSESLAFMVLRLALRKTSGAFIVLAIMNLPQVHGRNSIVYDVMHNLVGGSLSFANPLSYLYETAGVSYATWLPGGQHGLWFLMLLAVALFFCGLFLSRKRDYC